MQSYEKPVVEVVDAAELAEVIGVANCLSGVRPV
jgi:hypothetical protein